MNSYLLSTSIANKLTKSRKLGEDFADYFYMKYVYIITSINCPGLRYIGLTADLKRRLAQHNSGNSTYTAKFRPWKLETYIAFSDHQKALAFEAYLKTGAGWAFSNKRF